MKRANPAVWAITGQMLMMGIVAGPAGAHPILPDPPSSRGSVVAAGVQSYDPTSSINAITGANQPTSTGVTVVKETNGFDWDAALVGALGALGLVAVSLVTVRTVRRHGRFAVGTRA
jgi:hypothetical protein